MTASATVKQADLKRIAKAAKAEGVTFWIQLDDVRLVASATFNDGVENDCVDVELPVDLLVGDRVVVIHPKKAEPNSVFHARHPSMRRGHYRAPVTSQLMVAA